MPAAVQRLHHPLELVHLLAVAAGRGVARRPGRRSRWVVAPVVRQAPVEEEALVDDVVHGQQLDRGDAERREVLDRGSEREPGVGAAEVLRGSSGWRLVKPLTCAS